MASPSPEHQPSPADLPPIQVERQDDAVIVRVNLKTLDDQSAKRLQEDTTTAAKQNTSLPIVIDLSPVKLLPSITLGTLVRMHNEFKSRRQPLMLAGLSPTVRGVMTITRLDRLFEIHDDLAAALKSVRP